MGLYHANLLTPQGESTPACPVRRAKDPAEGERCVVGVDGQEGVLHGAFGYARPFGMRRRQHRAG